MQVTKNRRWMKSVLKASEDCDVTMPWARGANRAAMIARRTRKSAKAKLAGA